MDADPMIAGGGYRPFRPFADWAGTELDLERWRSYAETLASLRSAASPWLDKSLEIVRRAAAVQTGAIEGLYDADRGFTFTVAAQSALMEAALRRRPDRERGLIQDQLAIYERIVDLATGSVPIAETWLRQLHHELCKSQKTYRVHTEHGEQEQALPLGEYKRFANHVRLADGNWHFYAPAEEARPEMGRLVAELGGEAFAGAHPILQAAYAHHALVAVHPFADGNGRVARALGSIYTCRSYSLPLLIFEDQRPRYYDALASADEGRFEPFVDFVLARCIDAVVLVEESIRAAERGTSDQVSEGLRRLYATRSELGHREQDGAAHRFGELLYRMVRARLESLDLAGGTVSVQRRESLEDSGVTYLRVPADPRVATLDVLLVAPPPAQATVERSLHVLISGDAGAVPEVVALELPGSIRFRFSVADLWPTVSSMQELRLGIQVESWVSEALWELTQRVERSMIEQGYRSPEPGSP